MAEQSNREEIEKAEKLLYDEGMKTREQDHELAVHVKGGLNNGCTPEEIMEAIYQTGIYAGVPCALNASRIANKAIEEKTGKQ